MAKLFPKINLSEMANAGERRVAELLVSQLDRNVEVFHGFHWLGNRPSGTVVEGECDFVLLDPTFGVLFIEVKGGELRFDATCAEWQRVSSSGIIYPLKRDPFEQVRQNMHAIESIILRALPGNSAALPFASAYAVIFPDCRFSGSLPPSIVPDLLIDAKKFSNFRTSIARIFRRFRREEHIELSVSLTEAVRQALYPRYQIIPVLWRKLEDQEQVLHRLTEEQKRLLDALENHAKAAIQGVAGSGKTLLALAKAQQAARRGLRTLFLCFNRPLKDWLSQIAAPIGDSLFISTYHGLAEKMCEKAGIPFFSESNGAQEIQRFWNETAPERLMQACELLGTDAKFDAVVIDEGQDFSELWLTSLDAVFREPMAKGCYYIFYDPNQNVRCADFAIPQELGQPFILRGNCRNTVLIAQHCADLINASYSVLEGAPLGEKPELVCADTIFDAFRAAGKSVCKWCMPNEGGLSTRQVAVLAPSHTRCNWPNVFSTIPVTTNFDDWRNGKGVLIASSSIFKGLEADAIVAIEEPTSETQREIASQYVARSRAKHLLKVIRVSAP